MDIDDIKRYRGDIFASEYLDRIAQLEAELAARDKALDEVNVELPQLRGKIHNLQAELADCKAKLDALTP